MAMKVLSGVLVTRECTDGEAIIDLDRNEIHEGTSGLELARTRQVGSGRYTGVPCKMFALRQIDVDVQHPRFKKRKEHNQFIIDDKSTSDDERYMGVKWESTSSSEIQEISYMVVGETD